jgi:multiple sugar transport system permease protein
MSISRAQPAARARQRRPRWPGVLLTVLTLALAALWAFPVLWTVSTSFRHEFQTISTPLQWLPHPWTLAAYQTVFKVSGILTYTWNSLLTTALITVVTIALALPIGYALSQLRLRSAQLILWTVLASLMVPAASLYIPLYVLMDKFNMINSYGGIILPQVISAGAVFIFKSFFDQIPKEVREAALVDGASEFAILGRIYVPMTSGLILTMALFTFIAAWNNFFWPLIIENSPRMMTLPIGITQAISLYGITYAASAAVAVLSGLPLVIAYVIFQKQITDSFKSALLGVSFKG